MPALARMDDRISRHQAEILAFLVRRAPRDAEELAQETWLRVARAAPDCESEAAFRGYAFTVARRLLIDHYRRRSARISLVPLESGVEPIGWTDPHAHAVAAETLAVVEAALAAMTPEMAAVFRMRMTSERSFKEIAALQGTPLNTALGRMHSATRKIRLALRDAGLTKETP